jgi:hypothetical protein
MHRVIKADLQKLVDRLNVLTGAPLTRFDTASANCLKENIGHCVLYSAYGLYGLHRISDADGGTNQILSVRHKRELYDLLCALVAGVEIGLSISKKG